MKELFDKLYLSNQNSSDSFDDVANEMMNHHVLCINGCAFKVVELEFYVNNSKNKNDADLYTHGNVSQIVFGGWYDHPAGIDFTIGNNVDTYGGILIRSIKDLESKKYINGPLNVKSYLNKFGYTKNKPLLNWLPSAESATKIYKVKRYGLPFKESQSEFYILLFFYIYYPL